MPAATIFCDALISLSCSRPHFGHVQMVQDIRLDCDNDALLLVVEQQGGIACHTGRERCFYQGDRWATVEPVIKSEQEIYGKK